MNRFLFLALSAMIATSAAGSNLFEKSEVYLYQTNDVLERRMPDAAKIASYIVQLQSVCQSFLAKSTTPETLDVVVAVRPGRLSRVWFVSSIGSENDPRRRLLRKKLEAVRPIKVTGGPIAFAFVARIAGGDGKARNGMPMPREWQDAATKGDVLVPDGVLDLVWPKAKTADQDEAPDGFITQVLEPTGGKILRPKNWFYTESHSGSSYTWILSLEDASKASYTTGVRIQTLVGIKEGTGKSPKEFVLDYLNSKKKEAKVLKTCEETHQGRFTRVCLETEEGPHHILYSLFWGNKMDIVVVSIAGTTTGLWDVYAETFNKMGALELIDLKRFEK